MRINKYLSDAGVCSRRAADKLIEKGLITVDGKVAKVGMQLDGSEKVIVDGNEVVPQEDKIILLFNKPKGIVTTSQKKEKDNIIDYINYPTRIYPIGRLDKNSTGLILLTNDGEIVNKIMRAGNYHEKEYIVSVNKDITDDFIYNMSQGVPILDTVTRKCKVQKLQKRKFKIILTQGLNRQIRRMCEQLGYKVVALKRVRIMNLELGSLAEGTYRMITEKELSVLNKMLEGSQSNSVKWRDYE